jgi:hypothetical protein
MNVLLILQSMVVVNIKAKLLAKVTDMFDYTTYAFQNCNELTTLDLTNVTSVGAYAFYRSSGTPKLVSITFGSNTTLGDFAFKGQNQLESTLCLNCKSIGQYAFQTCTSLREIIVTTDVTAMSQYALHDIGSVNRILCEATSKPSG